MKHLESVIIRVSKALLIHDISPQQAIIPDACSQDPPPIMGTLSELCGITTAAMTGSIDRMTALGLVARQPKQFDRRSIQIVLTSAGQDLITKLNDTVSTL